jgi:flagellar biogenesis protein FliO
MQTILVILTFSVAAGYVLKKFVWSPIFEGRQKTSGTIDGGKTKCGNKDCGCH